ncbi:MAG TPA: MarR family winged helix-turn-helix transcriptional regulator [Mycobacteriales bacterium]|jgi:DNA-binding MarR family transcriptional regulator|nr:MarR family winged helix-turn-helix transcriptional regulator [Mycobacteriales bacterium]
MAEPKWLNGPEARAWRGYRRMRALLDLQIARDLAADSRLSDTDYDVLSNLSEAADHQLRLTDLAALMLWSKSRLSHHITRMQQRGLVTREESPTDARAAVVLLTDAGWAAIRAAAPPHLKSVRRNFVDLLTHEELKALGDIAEKVVARLS